MIRFEFAKRIGLPMSKARQLAQQADGVTPLQVRGEVHCTVTRGTHSFMLDALVVDKLYVDILAGTLFMDDNDVATRPAKRQIIIKGYDIVSYDTLHSNVPRARRTQSYTLSAP